MEQLQNKCYSLLLNVENKDYLYEFYEYYQHLCRLRKHTTMINYSLLMDIIYQSMQALQDFLINSVPNLYYGIAALGSIYIFYHLFIILRGLWRLFFRKKQNFIKIYGEKSWVLVTGSSQGIGKQFAMQFAAQGFNIILLARTQSKLKAVQQEIARRYPQVQVKIVTADLMQQGQKDNINDVLPQLNKFKNISIIVNNAGMESLEKFTNLNTQKLFDLVNLNCFAVTAICYKFIPYFEKRTKQTGHKCGFINVGSVAGERPTPLFNIYSASKGYVGQLTNNLALEYPHINWLLLKPSRVTTAVTCFKKDMLSVTAQQCVTGALRDFGHQRQTNGALSHRIQSYVYRILPQNLLNLVWYKIMGPMTIEYRENYKKSQ